MGWVGVVGGWLRGSSDFRPSPGCGITGIGPVTKFIIPSSRCVRTSILTQGSAKAPQSKDLYILGLPSAGAFAADPYTRVGSIRAMVTRRLPLR